MNLNTIEPVAQITIAPMVRCVDIDGNPVPECERDIPHIEPDPTDPADWPAWTDNFFWEPTEVDPADSEAAAAALEGLPFPGLEPEPYEPTPEDLADYHRWCIETEARRLGLTIAPISGGAPTGPTGPTEAEKAEAMACCRLLDELAELRARVDRLMGSRAAIV